MGVNGITPFLKRFCPEVLQPIPGRFKALKGKRIVLDGTLITQRFHYGQDPHPNKHVLGWFRLAKELRDAGVSAICLFDGKERSEAKSGEVQRRKKARELVHTRGAIEKDRYQRIRGLQAALGEFEKLSEEGKRGVAGAFVSSEVVRKIGARRGLLEGEETGVEPVEAQPGTLIGDGIGDDVVAKGSDEVPPTHAKQLFQSLYLDYCANISQLASLPESTAEVDENGDEKEKLQEKPQEQVSDHVTTKAQHELTVQENAIWRDLSLVFSSMTRSIPSPSLSPPASATPAATPSTSSDTSPPPTTSPPSLSAIQTHLFSIQTKSHVMSSSFERRTNSPRESTYNESKALLRAAGIPCIDAPSAVEAEALGASVVLNGWADYVGSEDTDILIYQAPMLKNITARSEPLILVHGSDVRRALDLTDATYVDFALLLGTDFTTRIKGVGPMKALGYLRKFGTIEGVLSGMGGEEGGGKGKDIVEGVESAGAVELVEGDGRKEPKTTTTTKPMPLMDNDKYLAQVEVARMIFGRLPVVPEEISGLMERGDRECEGGSVGEVKEGEVGANQRTMNGTHEGAPRERSLINHWDDKAVREVLKHHKLEFVLLEMDYADFDYTQALGDNYFGDNPSAA